jgi:pyridoxamine 5'-phosphate oxidase
MAQPVEYVLDVGQSEILYFPLYSIQGACQADLVSADEAEKTDPGKSGTFSREEVSQIRREYCLGGLTREDLNPDPFAQFEKWFEQACQVGIQDPNAMSLATAGAGGRVTLRTVLLKGMDSRGFAFYTNLESTKARQMAENPQVSLLFPWLVLERQVIVTGQVETLSKGEILKYFLTRPLDSQLAAWSSPQSRVISSRSLLEMKFSEMKRKFSEGKVPVPSFWGGYRVVPETLEFWQGRPNRLHDRFVYSREEGNSWRLERMAP